LDARRDGRVADVGVDLNKEIAADDHRFQLGVIDVRRDDGAAGGDFAADELRCYFFGNSLWKAGEHGRHERICGFGFTIYELAAASVLLGKIVANDVTRKISDS